MLEQLCGKRSGMATITTDPPSASDPGLEQVLVQVQELAQVQELGLR